MSLSPAARTPLRPSCTRMLPGSAEQTAADVPGWCRCEWSYSEGLPDANNVQLCQLMRAGDGTL